MDYVYLAHDRVQWRTTMNTVMNFGFNKARKI
jgi:hypothetical protein